MVSRYRTISFLSDYGTADELVGVVKSVVRTIAPDVTVIDVTHEVPPYDVRAGGLALARSAAYLAPGVVLAVVDPGVGTPRRALAVEVGDGQSVLVGPDNGLLAPAVALVGGATRAVILTNPDYRLPAPSATFDGRDVFGPAAAHLCNGVPLTDLGPEVDPSSLLPGVIPVARTDGDDLVAEVLWVDRFGNAELNVSPEDLAGWGDRVHVQFGQGGPVRTASAVEAFGQLTVGQLGWMIDACGLVALCLQQRSAAAELGLAAGSEVLLRSLNDGEEAGDDTDAGAASPSAATPVQLGGTHTARKPT